MGGTAGTSKRRGGRRATESERADDDDTRKYITNHMSSCRITDIDKTPLDRTAPCTQLVVPPVSDDHRLVLARNGEISIRRRSWHGNRTHPGDPSTPFFVRASSE